ncbi:CDP-glycerol glycerophosphotransferase family protein [Nocardioides sp. Bht2]|uniref:bifunctional glycosyltransferase/CDP-glycerol:glycerophosphate glycerophosphotransferase n=1 Tax=Nocardioides sp. Bht2 TaxID=3392297 RepID=UPI0039B4B19A
MSVTSRIRHSLVTTAARGRRFTLRTRVGRRLITPEISVIIPFYNVEQYFEECLDSIRDGGVANIEVILVDDGSPDGSRLIAERFVARDHRFRLIIQENAGLGAARNTGVRAARGRYLTFVDSDDLLAPGALRELLTAAESSGSQIVVGAVERFTAARRWRASWVRDVHKVPLRAVRVEKNLPILRNLYTWNKLYRRDFFDSQGLWFREGVSYEDQPIVTQLLLAADAVDVLPSVVYRYRARDDGSSISQQTSTLKDLRDRVSAWRETEVALRDQSAAVKEAWFQTLFDAHFIWYVTSDGTADDEYWSILRAVVVELTDKAPAAVWDRAPAPSRVLLELVRQDRRDAVQEFARQSAHVRNFLFDSELTAAGIDLQLPFRDDADLDPELFLIRPEQMTLGHRLDQFRQIGDEIQVAGWAYVLKVDLARHDEQIELVLVDDRGTETAVETSQDPDFCQRHDLLPPDVDDWCDYRPGRFTALVPAAMLAGSDWQLKLRVRVGGHVVEDLITKALRRGPLGAPPAVALPDGERLVLTARAGHPVMLRRLPSAVRVEGAVVRDRVLSGRLADGAAQVDYIEAAVDTFAVRGRVAADRSFEITLPVPPQLSDAAPSQRWTLSASTGAPVVGETPVTQHGVVRLDRDRRLALGVVDQLRGVEFDEVTSSGEGTLTLAGHAFGVDVTQVRATLVNAQTRTRSHAAGVVDSAFRLDLPLTHEVFRFGDLPLPVGAHRVQVEVNVGGRWREIAAVNAHALLEELPIVLDVPTVRGSVGRGGREALDVQINRPTGTGSTRQSQAALVRQAESQRGKATTRGILFRSYFGEKATDNGVAIQAELARRGSDLPVYWAVQDHSTPVPSGAIPVVVNTPEWFELLGSVTYYVDNMYQPTYHHKPEGQVLVQTFHGYPFKQMGLPHWRHQHFSQSLIDSYARRSAEWDYLVSPARYATPLLTRDFGYDGPVLEIGYPRNDVLFAQDRDQVREATRESLGLRPGQRAVLYAPTFRDYLARNNNEAVMSDFLDFDLIRRELGDDTVVLLRGHAFNARTGQRTGSMAGMIDVTDYPEVSDLYLAADVCIADYSSLRFDFGVTGKPMIFLVPDLQRYVDSRGWLFDFEPTAPGPLVSTTDEVVHHLRNLDAMVAEYADAYAQFRADFLDLEDGHAAQRFVDAVIAPRGDL